MLIYKRKRVRQFVLLLPQPIATERKRHSAL